MTRRATTLTLAALAAFAAGCANRKSETATVQTAVVEPRDIVVTAQATGTVEPIDTIPVKSQASGMVMKMPVDVGSQVKPGDLLAQLDTRLSQNDYDRTLAAERAALASVQVNDAALKRADALYAQKVITATEHEAAVVAAANSRSALTAAQTALKTAQQNLEYATIRAQVGGTVISKNAAVGTVVSSAISNVGGGSTLLTLADLHQVRMRALVNETDIGNVTTGMPVSVTIDAFPNRTFPGRVEKVEPQAIIQNSVTMFPVLISIPNTDLALLPGMNGEVSIVTQQRMGAVAVPNDAVRSMRDAASVAPLLGLNPDSLRAMLASQRNTPAGGGNGGPNAGARGGQGGQGGFGGNITVDSATCKTITATLQKSGATAQLDSLRGLMRMSGGMDTTLRARMMAVYKHAGVNADTARACMRRNGGGGGFGGGAGGARGGGAGGSSRSGGPQIVFVKEGKKWAPRRVSLGVSDFDYSEVRNGLQQGDTVALLGTAVLQAQRDQASQRARAMTGNGLPGTGGSQTGSRPGGGGAGGGGGGRPR
jgi:HlyD family secretion protein